MKINNEKLKKLKLLANNIRNHALDMTSRGSSSHIGSVFSIADILNGNKR